MRVEDLWVRYRTTQEKHPTLKYALTQLHRRSTTKRTIDALRGVSFEVPAGAVYGVIGPNGAGKSTLFRTIGGIVPPTAGTVSLFGQVTPLLSLGVGFDRELTGRENITLGGLARGLDRQTIGDQSDEIMAFADLGEAIDYPMRTYSSGMFGRLGFSIAAYLDPEILLIDEALGAGDAAFRHKCTEKMTELCERDCTVMIVSHGMEIVKQLAEQTLWLDHGTVQGEGPTDEVVAAYLESQGIHEEESAVMEDL